MLKMKKSRDWSRPLPTPFHLIFGAKISYQSDMKRIHVLSIQGDGEIIG